MKTSLRFLVFLILISACNTTTKESGSISKSYRINGEVFDKNGEIIYLKIVLNNQIELEDSTQINNNKFVFKGKIDFPHKAILQLKDYTNAFPFILADENCTITLNTSQPEESRIINSPINDELAAIKSKSAAIYRKIDYLYPQLQKSRIENDIENLNKINRQIKAIIQENKVFLYNYIEQNPDNYLAGLLLNDLWQNATEDSIKLKQLSKHLSPNIRQTLNFAIH
jgi:hypothetical protein